MPPQTTRDGAGARAPYNFIPLNERVLAVTDQDGLADLKQALPDHDRYDPDRKTGYFEVTATTESPLYIRGMLTAQEAKEREKHKNKADFFRVGDDEMQPRIPGSSLRGMIRSLVEIVTLGKLSRAMDASLFYRDLRARHYQRRIVQDLGTIEKPPHPEANSYQAKVRGGFLRQHDGYWEIEECLVARVETNEVTKVFGLTSADQLYELDGKPLTLDIRRNPNQTP